jgi:hypothetical protein
MKQYEVAKQNLAVMTNAVELAAAIIANIAGNAISNQVEGQPVDDSYLKTAVASKLNAALIPYLGAPQNA